MITIHKELFLSGENRWQHLDAIRVKGYDEVLWPMLHSAGDTFRRMYSNITTLDISFSAPECFVHHINATKLIAVRKMFGTALFDRTIGCFPFDAIDLFEDADAVTALAKEYGVLDARIIAWKE